MYPLIDGDTYNIPDSAFSSSNYNGDTSSTNVRLYSYLEWTLSWDDPDGAWLQADLGAVFYVAAISTQGSNSIFEWGDFSALIPCMVTQYKISVSEDGSDFVIVTDATGEEVRFEGNTDGDTYDAIVRNELPAIVQARSVRLIVIAYDWTACWRWEIEGCPLD